MIDTALKAIKLELSAFIKRLPEFNLTDTADAVELCPVSKPDGSSAMKAETLVLALANIEEERVNKSQQTAYKASDGKVSHINPEIRLNLYLLVIANFDKYLTGLQYLSAAVRFFQSKCVFTRQNTANLDPSIEKLITDLHTINFEQQNHLWGSLGAKYQPSVMYKVRLISIQEGLKSSEAPPIMSVDSSERAI